ncbi:DUF1642 domain-containing protein [Streptococcus suis]|nr:DUF1642 domain-containing protein [Streptococcus suis]
MNKQEAIEKAKEYGEFYSNAFGGTVKMVPVGPIIDIIYEIHEPQKVVVPKFVAEWIEHYKGRDYTLRDVLKAKLPAELNNWLLRIGEDMRTYPNQETFARAWLDGYELEQLFTVDIPNPVLTDNSDSVTVLTKIDSGVVLTDVVDYIGRKQNPIYHLTESEIKQDFEWAWQWAEPVEVE